MGHGGQGGQHHMGMSGGGGGGGIPQASVRPLVRQALPHHSADKHQENLDMDIKPNISSEYFIII